MTHLMRSVVSVVALGMAACGGAEVPSAEEVGPEALVSSESQLTCASCGSTRYRDDQVGFGFTCVEARQDARSALEWYMASTCPAGTCNVVWTNGLCMPVGSTRDEGFDMALSVTYSCCL